MKKMSLLSLLIVINCLLDSCSPSATCFNIEISDIKNFTLDGFVESATGDTTAVNDYAILLDAESISASCMNQYSFGGSLLAEEPIIILVDEMTNISIKSNADLSVNYPAESELKDLFIPIRIQLDCQGNATTTSDCIMDYFSVYSYNSLEEAFNGLLGQSILFKNEDNVELFSLSTSEVITSNTHEFTIKFDFKSGISTELKTGQIVLE